jgi:hypothetical protein
MDQLSEGQTVSPGSITLTHPAQMLGGNNNEGKSFSKTYLRKVQNHKKKRKSNGYL